jgi:hypothetical protein
MFLPWYGKSVTETVKNSLRAAGYNLSAFGAFSFVEAAVLLVASAALALLFARAERRAFHLPGGDGLVILAGGVWVSVLIFYRMLDKPGTTGNDRLTTTVGLQWGIFVAMAASISLAYAGARVRVAHRPEPELGDDPTVPRSVAPRPPVRRPPSPPSPRPPGPSQRPPAPPFDADDPDAGATPSLAEEPPTRVVRRVPRFDDLDAEWVSADQFSLEADPPTESDGQSPDGKR